MKTNATNSARRSPRRRRILIVNGVTVWREVITILINRSPDLQVCGEAMGEKAALEMVRRLRPNLVLTEVMRPQDLEFIRKLHQRHRSLPILAFSFRDEEAYAPRALDAGACGYLMKDVDGHTLVAGIRKVLNGQVALSPAMRRRLRNCRLSRSERLTGVPVRGFSKRLRAVRRRAYCAETDDNARV